LTRVEPEAIRRIAPRTATGAPERYALAGKLLYLHPTPDVAYQLDHKYFVEDVNWQPTAAQYLPVLFATAMALHRQHRQGPVRQLLQLYQTELTMLTQNLFR